MPHKIEDALIWRRLYEWLKLRTLGETEPFQIDDGVKAVINLNEILGYIDVRNWGAVSRTAAAGVGWIFAEVPANRRYTVYAFYVDRTGGDGTLTDSRAYNNAESRYVTLMTQSAAADYAIEPRDLTYPLIFESGMKFGVYVAAITSDSAWNVYWYGKVDKLPYHEGPF